MLDLDNPSQPTMERDIFDPTMGSSVVPTQTYLLSPQVPPFFFFFCKHVQIWSSFTMTSCVIFLEIFDSKEQATRTQSNVSYSALYQSNAVA